MSLEMAPLDSINDTPPDNNKKSCHTLTNAHQFFDKLLCL